ncbi:MAG TPA: iron-sulfur cluster repair di-iron protein [Geothrix sp.]|nr:iron-sulfur cluster repair di-iron protein [Geothrix sp.]
MKLDPQTPLATIVAERPETMRYFEAIGLDYCCHGQQSLGIACTEADLDLDTVLEGISRLAAQPALASPAQWQEASLEALTRHLETTHHAYLKEELPRLGALMTKVAGVHGANHPELNRMSQVFQALIGDLMPHMMKEEQILFPFIRSLEEGRNSEACFPTVQSPIRVMEMEHEAVGAMLSELRSLSQGYQVPADGCASFKSLYAGLLTLEQDTHLHIYLENQILHPRALAREAVVQA